MRYVTIVQQTAAWFLLHKTGGEVFPPEQIFLITETDDYLVAENGDFLMAEESI